MPCTLQCGVLQPGWLIGPAWSNVNYVLQSGVGIARCRSGMEKIVTLFEADEKFRVKGLSFIIYLLGNFC